MLIKEKKIWKTVKDQSISLTKVCYFCNERP